MRSMTVRAEERHELPPLTTKLISIGSVVVQNFANLFEYNFDEQDRERYGDRDKTVRIKREKIRCGYFTKPLVN